MDNDDWLFCNVCGNIYYWRDGNKLVCRCGNAKEITRDEVAIPPVVEEAGEYDFKNKEASRRVVFKYLETMRERGLIKGFPEMKVLILTSPEALDFKQILRPLGFKNENVTIIERDRDAFDAICKNPVLKDCRKLNMELIEYDEKKHYDLIYLDFKSNLCWDVMDIIKQMLVQNSHDGTVFYINVQMAREVSSVMDLYSTVKTGMIDDCNEAITMNNDQRKKLSTFNEMVKAVKEAKPRIEEYVIVDAISRAPEFKDVPKPDMHVEEMAHRKKRVKELLEDAGNFHLVRQHVIRYYIRLICDLYLNYADRVRDAIANKKISISTAFIPESKDSGRKRLIPVLRYLARSLSPYYFTQVMYKNKSNKPFLSSLFVLKDHRSLMGQLGYEDFSKQIMRAFMIMQFKRMDLLRQRNFDRSLYISKVLEFGKNGRKTERQIENEVRLDLNDIRNIYLSMEKLELVSLKDGFATFNFINSNLAQIRYTFNATALLRQIKSMGKNVKRVDESHVILSFTLINRLLARVEKDLEFSVSADEATVIDIENGEDDAKTYIDENFDQIFSDDIAAETIKSFKDELASYIDEAVVLLNNVSAPDIGRKLREAGSNAKPGEMKNGATRVIVSINSLLKEKTTIKEGQNMSEEPASKQAPRAVKEIAYEFINNNPGKKAKEIAAMVNEHVKRTVGIDPCITDCQVRAYKYWNRVNATVD